MKSFPPGGGIFVAGWEVAKGFQRLLCCSSGIDVGGLFGQHSGKYLGSGVR
jgi:hypothetical protein